MNKIFSNIFISVIISLFIILPAYSQDAQNTQTFSVTIPKAIKINGVGLSAQNQYHGTPQDGSTTFDLEVIQSQSGDTWELTTINPVGVSISYNSGGSILAVFASMTRTSDGYVIPPSDISIYPSKVIFANAPNGGGGDYERIFHFHPKIRVSKDTPPGNYIGNITFTVLGQ